MAQSMHHRGHPASLRGSSPAGQRILCNECHGNAGIFAFSFIIFNVFFIFLFSRDTQREKEREAETQAEGEAGSLRAGSWMQDSGSQDPGVTT